MTREEALASKGRHGTVRQDPRYATGPLWYGQVVEVHSSGDYVQFLGGNLKRPRWQHRTEVTLHPLREKTPE